MGQQRNPSVNQGILATNVSANLMAVGAGASSVQTVHADERQLAGLLAELERLRAGLRENLREPDKRAILEDDLSALEGELRAPEVKVEKVGGVLQALSKKLHLVGGVLTEAAAIVGPIKTIAEAFKIPLALLGLG